MLTDTLIRKLPAATADAVIPAGGRLGLYLRVRAATGRKTWITRRRVAGQWRVETLGDWPALTALNALRQASTATPRVAAVVTFGAAAESVYAEAIEPRYRSAPLETKAYLTRDCASLHARRLDRVTQARSLRSRKDAVREIPIARPVHQGQVVLALSDVIMRAVAVERFVDRGHLRVRSERRFPVELKYGTGVHDAQEFSARIRPEILLGTVHRDRARCD